MSFADHMCDFDAIQCCRGRNEGLEPLHLPGHFLMNQCSCSIMLFRYLTCNTSISQNQSSNNSRQFMFCNLARFAPSFRWLCNSRPIYLSLRCKIWSIRQDTAFFCFRLFASIAINGAYFTTYQFRVACSTLIPRSAMVSSRLR